MLSDDSVAKIRLLAEEVSQREGCRLYDIEFASHGKNRVLRVYIDAEPGPVAVDQCANVSRGLSLLLDVQDIIPGGRYELEVSSPGIERVLRLPWHFKKAVGQEVKIIAFEPIAQLKGEVRSLTSELVDCDENEGTFIYKGEPVKVPFANIKKAQVVFNIKRNEKRG